MVSVLFAATTVGAATREPTVHTHARAPTVAVHHLAATHPHRSSPTSSPRLATMATVTPRPVDAMATAEARATRGNAPGRARAPLLKWSGTGIERGSAAHTNSQRNTNMSGQPATALRGGSGSGPAPTTGRGSAATRANTMAAADTQAMGGTGAEAPRTRLKPTGCW